jgi:primosomal protein N' (replication factor Y)
MFYKVVTASRSAGIGNGLTYELAEKDLAAGTPVRVPLRNGLVEGIVMDVMKERTKEQYDLKQIKETLGDEPLLNEAQIQTVRWMAEYYVTTLRHALSVWLPPPPWSKALPTEIVGYRRGQRDTSILKGKKQIAVAEYLLGKEWVSKEELHREAGASADMLRVLKQKRVIIEEKRREESAPATNTNPIRALPILTPAQEAAYEFIQRDKRPTLLFGVTGSGKTEIYAQLIADAIRQGKTAMMLVPEILLTEHSIARFGLLLKRDAISVIHSKLTQRERREEWKRIRSGAVSLVIGSRSALFSPLPRLGLIVLDEEHEWTYKNEQLPRYHARDTAETLARFSDARLVLGSATPSLESWARAKNGTYNIVKLPLRYREMPLPKVQIVDLATAQFGKLYPFTPPLLQAIAQRLAKKEQCVLFLNRRGVASAVLCMACRRRIVCPDSQLPFTVHHTSQGRPYLLDHTTGVIAEVPSRCPHCGSADIKPIGAGTQKIELILASQFPHARIIRADADTMQDPREMREILRRMRSREADILLGTQSVVKGLDLPEVTLAAVLLADLGLSLPHFRAGERIFSLLTQLTGRSGRAKAGEVIIQTFRPEAPEVIAASKHETEKYLNDELRLRVYSEYPPASAMIRFLIRGDDAEKKAKKFYNDVMRTIALEKSDVKAYVAPTFFGGGKVWHILLRGAEPRALLQHLDLRNVVVDVDPLETM